MMECNNEKKGMLIIQCNTDLSVRRFGSSCTAKCNHIKRYVCGSNGVTYENPCMFKCAQALNPSK
ncbi:hypothetical protein O3M35_007838 [Rhynocoris fuscipes]|uniref:Kazal-like domain-containing protein n=1 Tax=Rhynocoris fuscipes TaxID=488301 RepID=A0AAW1DAP8_9HEMI